MKKYLFTFFMALIVGFFLCNFFLKQYDDYNGIKVSSTGEDLFFIQFGVFSSLESLEENTISLQNYVYSKQDNLYYVYVGITNLEENANKIVEFYKNKGFNTIIKKFQINNKEFTELLVNFDQILKDSNDATVISSVINQVLMKYEEVVISGG